MRSPKRRDFLFSLKNETEGEYKSLIDIDCRYIILGREIDEYGETKIQGYVYFNCPRTFQNIKNIVPRVEMEELKENTSLNYDFCSKQNNFEERGQIPNKKRPVIEKPNTSKTIIKSIEFEKSFASHEKAKYWSSLNVLKPEDVFLNSHKNFWFDCPKCNHSYESILNNINANDSGCPYCYNRKLCGKEDCKLCFDKSFASHEKSEFWSKKNHVAPISINKGTNKKYWFNCDKCNHELVMSLKCITDNNQWCCYCSHQKLCKNEECIDCFSNSFASVENSKYWNDVLNKDITPRETFKNTNNKYWFDCNECGNVFQKIISDISSKKSWCPICKNKTELKLFRILSKKYDNIERAFSTSWCKNIKCLPFDFVIKERKIIIELDGPHHFRQVSNWGNYEENQKRDIYKMKCANDNGFSVIRLLQKDVLFDKYEWFRDLENNINKITDENRVQNIYMCLNDEYKDFDININWLN
jgi:very-short-patch-repair endonuclease